MLVKMQNKRSVHVLLMGQQNCITTIEISVVVPQVDGTQSNSGPSQRTLRHVIQKALHHTTKICSTKFFATLFIRTKNQKHPRCPSIDEWMMKLWYINTIQYYLDIKKYISKYAGKLMELEKITLIELSQTQKDKLWDIFNYNGHQFLSH